MKDPSNKRHLINVVHGDINCDATLDTLQEEEPFDLFWADHFTIPKGDEAKLIKRMSDRGILKPNAVVIMTASEGHKHTARFPRLRSNLVKYCSIPGGETNIFLATKYHQMMVIGVENGGCTLPLITGKINVPKLG